MRVNPSTAQLSAPEEAITEHFSSEAPATRINIAVSSISRPERLVEIPAIAAVDDYPS